MNEQKDNPPTQSSQPSNSITNSPIVNSPGAVQAPGGTVIQGAQPRVVADQRAMAAVFKAREPRTIYLLIHGQQQETRNYAGQIAQAIIAGGWRAEIINQSLIPTIFGVHCFSEDSEVREIVSLAFKAGHLEGDCVSRKYDYPYVIVVGPQP